MAEKTTRRNKQFMPTPELLELIYEDLEDAKKGRRHALHEARLIASPQERATAFALTEAQRHAHEALTLLADLVDREITTKPPPPIKPYGRYLHVDGLTVDLTARDVKIDNRPLTLTRLEFDLLATLAHNPSRVFTKNELLLNVWGYPTDAHTRTLDSTVCRLRAKLGDGYIVTIWGVGYRLTSPPALAAAA